MKLAVFGTDGRARIGVVTGADILDLTQAWSSLMRGDAGPVPTTLVELLSRPGVLPSIASRLGESSPDEVRTHRLPLSSVSLRAPLEQCGKLICVASNYTAHIVEAGQQAPSDRRAYTPWLFLKPSTSIIGPGAPIPVPRSGQAIDWEVELAAVIGKTGKHIPVDEALRSVAGYTILNDVSERRFKAPPGRGAREWDKFFDWLHGKWFDGFAPMGPFLVTANEIPDPQKLTLELRLNGRVRQHGSTASMIYPVAELVSFASSIMTLQPGDVIATGTPQGVGSAAGEFLRSGDTIECEIEGLDILANPVRAEDELAAVR
jgi:2-keto-4-pentenoate hydratase/2-oxohepta-3-ene-1,7-dioic acid hydratase in catechol pathway